MVVSRVALPPSPPAVRCYEVSFLWPEQRQSSNAVDGVGLLFGYLRWAATRTRPALLASIEDIT